MPDIYDILKIKNEQGEWITVPALKGDAGNYTAGDNIIIEDDVISAIDTIYDDTEVKADIAALESGKADKAATYTKTEADALLDDKADADAVYTKTETDALLAEKADSDAVYTKTEADNLLDAKADATALAAEVMRAANVEGALADELDKTDLIKEEIFGTTQEINFNSSGQVSSIIHKKSGAAYRTDTFTYGTNSITEERAITAIGTLTIATDLATLVTTVVFTAA